MSQIHHKKIPEWLIQRLPVDVDAGNAEFIPQKFADSTHDLWRLQSRQNRYFLKLCSNTSSPFWEIMQQLFEVNLEQDIQYFDSLYRHISDLTPLQIPQLIQAESVPDQGAFIFSKEISGEMPETTSMSQNHVQQLALHLSQLHADTHKIWGALHNPSFNSNQWSLRLKHTLEKSAHKWGGDNKQYTKYLNQALLACDSISKQEFVPLMADLRWDQFLLLNNEDMALLDLDAFVFAPRELELVLLEYVLDKQQMEWFKGIYAQYHVFPEIEQVRPAYQLLLFYMQVLGEQDIEKWMNNVS